jgi:hypothetical protein
MSLDERLDRIVARSQELEHLLASGLTGDAFTEASREYGETEEVVRQIVVCGKRNSKSGMPKPCWATRKCGSWLRESCWI